MLGFRIYALLSSSHTKHDHQLIDPRTAQIFEEPEGDSTQVLLLRWFEWRDHFLYQVLVLLPFILPCTLRFMGGCCLHLDTRLDRQFAVGSYSTHPFGSACSPVTKGILSSYTKNLYVAIVLGSCLVPPKIVQDFLTCGCAHLMQHVNQLPRTGK